MNGMKEVVETLKVILAFMILTAVLSSFIWSIWGHVVLITFAVVSVAIVAIGWSIGVLYGRYK